MSIELLAKQGRDRVHGGLASIDSAKLRQLRDQSIRSCFTRLEETSNRMEHVARIYSKVFVNDAAARSINATYYTLQNTEGNIVWIAFGDDKTADYTRLRALVMLKVSMLICVGSDNSHIINQLEGCVPAIKEFDTISAAVHHACYYAAENSKVIFSPATSQGPSSEEASRIYRHEVNEL